MANKKKKPKEPPKEPELKPAKPEKESSPLLVALICLLVLIGLGEIGLLGYIGFSVFQQQQTYISQPADAQTRPASTSFSYSGPHRQVEDGVVIWEWDGNPTGSAPQAPNNTGGELGAGGPGASSPAEGTDAPNPE